MKLDKQTYFTVVHYDTAEQVALAEFALTALFGEPIKRSVGLVWEARRGNFDAINQHRGNVLFIANRHLDKFFNLDPEGKPCLPA